MFCSNPDALPSLANLRDGSAQIADLGSASYLGDWHRAFASHPGFLGSRTVVEQWSMSPVVDDTVLELLQLALPSYPAVGIDESLEQKRDSSRTTSHNELGQTVAGDRRFSRDHPE